MYSILDEGGVASLPAQASFVSHASRIESKTLAKHDNPVVLGLCPAMMDSTRATDCHFDLESPSAHASIEVGQA